MLFISLSDPDHTVSKRYEQQVKLLKLGRLQAQMIIDKKGLIRYLHYGRSMSDIVENGELLAKLNQLNLSSAPSASL